MWHCNKKVNSAMEKAQPLSPHVNLNTFVTHGHEKLASCTLLLTLCQWMYVTFLLTLWLVVALLVCKWITSTKRVPQQPMLEQLLPTSFHFLVTSHNPSLCTWNEDTYQEEQEHNCVLVCQYHLIHSNYCVQSTMNTKTNVLQVEFAWDRCMSMHRHWLKFEHMRPCIKKNQHE